MSLWTWFPRNVPRLSVCKRLNSPPFAICNPLANEILGSMFDYDYLPLLNVAGGILLGWHRDHWVVSDVDKRRFSLLAKVARAAVPQECWWITVVYGPQADQDKGC